MISEGKNLSILVAIATGGFKPSCRQDRNPTMRSGCNNHT